jgi:hypothetical protein
MKIWARYLKSQKITRRQIKLTIAAVNNHYAGFCHRTANIFKKSAVTEVILFSYIPIFSYSIRNRINNYFVISHIRFCRFDEYGRQVPLG